MPLMARFSVALLWAGLLNPRVRWRWVTADRYTSLEYMAEIGSKEIDGVLGPWKRGQIELGAEGVVLPEPCPVGGECCWGHGSMQEVS